MSTQSRNHGRVDEEPIDLLGEKAASEPAARERLLARLRPELARYSETWTADGTSDDAVDDLCSAVVAALSTFRAEREDFWSFVLGVVSPTRPDGGGDHDRARELRVVELLDELPKRQRSVLLLRVQGRLTTQDTARLLGSTPAVVRVLEQRAVTAIRRAWRRSALPGTGTAPP